MAEPSSLLSLVPEDDAEARRLRAAAALLASTVMGATQLGDDGGDPFAGLEALPSPARGNDRIGPYRLGRELGRGGMGTVYAATRADGEFEQTVALKLLRPDRVASEAQARFQRERAILARLQHPNIARLLDGGISPQGEVWFALELVEGVALIEYAIERGLDLRQRLLLFLEVCAAVGYAHRNLIVHRDLKPSNIMVDGDGHAKLLDFGIAKLIESDGEDLSKPLTLADQRVLTPDYAAPEQILGEPITTATDIYALGLLLFELLTGSRCQNLHALSWPEAMRYASTADAAAPSRAAAERSSSFGLAPARLRGDLDAIVLKALRREPERRYATAAELADDLQRFLDGYPVLARGDARGYRIGRLLRRHRVGFAAALAVLLALSLGLGAALWQAHAARLEAQRANEVRAFVLGLFRGIDPEQARGHEVSARELLDGGASRVRSELANQPEVQVEMLSTLGNLYLRLSQPASAAPLFEQALVLSRSLHSPDDPALAPPLVGLAIARVNEARYSEARVLLDEAERIFDRAGEDLDDLRSSAWGMRTRLLIRTDDMVEAERYARRRLAMAERRVGRNPGEYSRALGNLSWVLMWRDHWAEGEQLAKASLDAPGFKDLGPLEARRGLDLMASLLGLRGRYREALTYSDRNYEASRQSVGDQNIVTQTIRMTHAHLWGQTGRLEEAEAEMRSAFEYLQRAGQGATDDNSFMYWIMGNQLADRGKLREGHDLMRQSLERMRVQFGIDAKSTLLVERDLGSALVEMGDFAGAESLLGHSAERFRSRGGEHGMQYAILQVRQSELRHAQGLDPDAERVARGALATLEDSLGAEHDETGRAHHALGLALLGRDASASELEFKAALASYEQLFGPEDSRVVAYRFDWGRALAASDRPEAEGVLRASAETLARIEHDESPTGSAAKAWLATHGSKRTTLSSISSDAVVTGANGSAQR